MNLFEEIINHFQSNTQYQKFIKQIEKEYDIKLYKLSQYPLSYAQKNSKDLIKKYENNKLTHEPISWHENQRKLFVWFILSFLNYKMLDVVTLLDGCQRYWKVISALFWNKQIPFLKYQLLTLIKVKDRAIWKKQEQQLLIDAYHKYKKGDWNQIAKFIYMSSKCKIFKTAKQCRQRWNNHLNEQIYKEAWNYTQQKKLLNLVKQKGKKWSQITKAMPFNRTQHMIKNRYQSMIKKQLKRPDKRSKNEEIAFQNLLKEYQSQNQNIIQYCQSQMLDDQNQQIQQHQQVFKLKNQNQIIHQLSKSDNSKNKNFQIDGCNFSIKANYYKSNMIIYNDETMKLNSSLRNNISPSKEIPNQILNQAYSSVHSFQSGFFNNKQQINLQNSINIRGMASIGNRSSSFSRVVYDSCVEKDIFQSNKFD